MLMFGAKWLPTANPLPINYSIQAFTGDEIGICISRTE
jgi:hypothetical protein